MRNQRATSPELSRDPSSVETIQMVRRYKIMQAEYEELAEIEKKPTRSISELTDDEKKEFIMKLPQPGGLMYYNMQQDELERFMSYQLVKQLMEETLVYTKFFILEDLQKRRKFSLKNFF